jgi:hypothetical protein
MIEKKKCLLSPQKKTNKHLKNCNTILHVSANKHFAQNASAIWARLFHGEYDFAPGDRKAAMAFANAINLHFASRKKPLTFVVDRDGDLCSHHKIGRNDVYFPLGQWNETLPILLKVIDLIRGLKS